MGPMGRGLRYVEAAVLVAIVGACSSAAATATPAAIATATTAVSTPLPTAAPLNIALINPVDGIPFSTTLGCGAKAAGKEFNVNVSTQGSPTGSVDTQVQLLNGVMQRKPDGLVLAPDDATALIPTVQQIISGGTPVVTVDLSLSQPIDLQNLRPDTLALGASAADQMATILGSKGGKVLVLGWAPGIVANQQRADGFINQIKLKYPQIQLLPEQFIGVDQNKAAQATAATLQAHPDLAGIYTTHGIGAAGAAAAVLNANLKGKVHIVAFDADPQEVRDLNDGVYDALVAQPPYQEGYQAVKLLAQVLRKEVDPKAVQHQMYLPGVIVTRDNVSSSGVQPFLYLASC